MRTLLLVLLSGCGATSEEPAPDGDSDADTDGDSDGDSDADCNVPDTECPVVRPHLGGLCEGPLACTYEADGGTWDYGCHAGLWRIDDAYDCDSRAGCVPELTESCDAPFDGTLDGATIEIGPASGSEPFRAFLPNEQVPLLWGSQGAPMLEIRVRVSGAPAPDCVFARFTLTGPNGEGEPTVDRMKLRCGQSLSLFAIVPGGGELGCAESPGTVDLDITVEIQGIGAGTAHVAAEYQDYENCYG